MQSVKTEFKWSGGTSGGNYNAAYDVWFAKTQPTPGSYNDAVSGFIMVWLYKPASFPTHRQRWEHAHRDHCRSYLDRVERTTRRHRDWDRRERQAGYFLRGQ